MKTKRKMKEKPINELKELQDLKKHLSSFIKALPSVVVWLTPTGQILEFNPEAERIYERKRSEVLGKNYFWRLNIDYRIGSNLQTTVSYNGRVQGAGKVIHTMRAEARAYF